MDREERNWTLLLCPVGIPHLKIRKSDVLTLISGEGWTMGSSSRKQQQGEG